jgi:hypothetical protein
VIFMALVVSTVADGDSPLICSGVICRHAIATQEGCLLPGNWRGAQARTARG